ncbi:MAG: hypothetical protein A2289_20850 [Deltaproteobacteria bacterium RIFOXYA12_FULL_58_15]|nr:MAG: hypothetical protein A2289_20850 [Deltaproteobacteria bacterium RIFOXYA12_FULL_58_15]OGR11929.1 MAG: hypothetical protein A2341_17180 [Deltaproteobacteria bacterium RIFOXYB12_FULL_58_9]
MARKIKKSAVADGGAPRMPPTLDVHHAWNEIRRGPAWKSLALVAVDDGPPPTMLAQSFGYLATEEKTRRILVVNASTQRPSGAATKVPETEDDLRELALGNGSAICTLDDHLDYLQLSRFDPTRAARLLVGAPHTIAELTGGPLAYDGVIFAIDSLLAYPEATQLARTVDVVVLCIRLGTTSLGATRRIMEIVGAEKIVGSIAFAPGAKPT